jgi:protein TonB
MFDSFEKATDEQQGKRFAASSGAAIGILAVLGAAAVALASRPTDPPSRPPLEVTFHQPPAAPEPPPPPPSPSPRPRAARAAPSRAAADRAAPATPLEIPQGELAEADEDDFAVQLFPEGGLESTILGGDPPPPPRLEPAVAAELDPARSRPIFKPDRAVPPRPLATNRLPAYPEGARIGGLQGTVTLEIIVTETGHVGELRVIEGAEPFVAAAIAAVRAWRYEPARVEGQPTAVHRIVKVPFRLRD